MASQLRQADILPPRNKPLFPQKLAFLYGMPGAFSRALPFSAGETFLSRGPMRHPPRDTPLLLRQIFPSVMDIRPALSYHRPYLCGRNHGYLS